MVGKKNKILPIPKVLGIAIETKIRFLTWKTWEYLEGRKEYLPLHLAFERLSLSQQGARTTFTFYKSEFLDSLEETNKYLKGCINLLKVQLTLSQMQRKRREQNHINCLIFSLAFVITQSLVLEIQHLSSGSTTF